MAVTSAAPSVRSVHAGIGQVQTRAVTSAVPHQSPTRGPVASRRREMRRPDVIRSKAAMMSVADPNSVIAARAASLGVCPRAR
jgi:hypothetical protein